MLKAKSTSTNKMSTGIELIMLRRSQSQVTFWMDIGMLCFKTQYLYKKACTQNMKI